MGVSFSGSATSVADLESTLQRGFQPQLAEPSKAAVVMGQDGSARVSFQLSGAAQRVANGYRVEFKGKTADIDRGSSQWYAFSYLQTVEMQRWRKPVLIGQVHTAQLGPITAPPPFGILVRDGRLEIALHRSDRSAIEIDKSDNRLLQQMSVSAGAVTPGQWTCVLVRAVWSSTMGKGELTVWRDAERVLFMRNVANSYPTALGMYPKFGLYAYNGIDGDQISLEADILKVLDGKLPVEQVRAQARCADK